MGPEWLIIGIAAALGLYMAWTIGANDVANSMADAVGSGAISVKWAVILAAICEFSGAVLVGAKTTDTVRQGIVQSEWLNSHSDLMILGMACSLLGAAIWLHVSSHAGLPVSTTHSIVGAIAGFGIAAAGWSAVNWGTMFKVIASWFISPVVGGIAAFLLFHLIRRLILSRDAPIAAAIRYLPFFTFLTFLIVSLATVYKGLNHVLPKDSPILTERNIFIASLVLSALISVAAWVVVRRKLAGKINAPLREQLGSVELAFAPLVIVTSCSVAFAHGANDVANSVGPLAAIVSIVHEHAVMAKVAVPFWVLALGGFGIVFGLSTYGWRVMKTVGTKLTELTPTRGVAADIAAATVVLVCSRMGLPISTTHVLVGAILGVGFARGIAAVDTRVMRHIFGAWLITVPCAALFTVLLFLTARMIFLPG